MKEPNKPIVIAGFGRSGTTWLSDIISKSLGGMLLFEPFHPKIYPYADQIAYATSLDDPSNIKTHWQEIKHGEIRNKWLIRNHLRTPYEDTPSKYIDLLWDNTPVLGFKTIRANHLLSLLNQTLGGIRPLYIIRHPLACLTSINRRPMFWKEFGWDWHWQTFLQRLSRTFDIEHSLHSRIKSDNEKIIFMWAISQHVAISQVKDLGGCITSYEDLYLTPFEEVHKILSHLGYEDHSIHPSYLFEPSMTSMRTFHNSGEYSHLVNNQFPNFFWEEDLSPQECRDLMQLIRDLPINQPEIFRYLNA